MFVYTAPSPLGPWRFQSDINLRGNVSAGFGKLEVSAFSRSIVSKERKANHRTAERVVHGQSTAVVPIETASGTEYMWLSDRWQSTDLWSSDLQYWGLLEFDDAG